jgi:ribosomal protein S18 acetylase RimI-like enzyme
MAVYHEYRGKGIGTKFLEIAAEKAPSLRLPWLSLIVFEENERAKRLYERHGFYEVMRENVVPHELIHHTGDALLMVKDIK